MQSFPNNLIRHKSRVRRISLSGNNFVVLRRGDLESLSRVQLLVLDESNIGDVEEDAFGRMDRLERLHLNANRLARVPASLPSASLTCLYLRANAIGVIGADDLANLDRLQQLDLSANVIELIEMAAFDQLVRFVSSFVLDISFRRVKSRNGSNGGGEGK